MAVPVESPAWIPSPLFKLPATMLMAVAKRLDVPNFRALRHTCKLLRVAVELPAAPLTIPVVSWVASLPASEAALAGAAEHATVLVNVTGHILPLHFERLFMLLASSSHLTSLSVEEYSPKDRASKLIIDGGAHTSRASWAPHLPLLSKRLKTLNLRLLPTDVRTWPEKLSPNQASPLGSALGGLSALTLLDISPPDKWEDANRLIPSTVLGACDLAGLSVAQLPALRDLRLSRIDNDPAALQALDSLTHLSALTRLVLEVASPHRPEPPAIALPLSLPLLVVLEVNGARVRPFPPTITECFPDPMLRFSWEQPLAPVLTIQSECLLPWRGLRSLRAQLAMGFSAQLQLMTASPCAATLQHWQVVCAQRLGRAPIAWLWALPQLRSLDLRTWLMCDLAAVARMQQLTRLKLTWHPPALEVGLRSALSVSALAELTGLRSLSIVAKRASRVNGLADVATALTGLTHFHGRFPGEAGTLEAVPGLWPLQDLVLKCAARDPPLRLTQPVLPASLTQLHLSHATWHTTPGKRLSSFTWWLPNLQRLSVSGDGLLGFRTTWVAFWPTHQLVSLKIAGPPGCAALLESCPNLTELVWSCGRVIPYQPDRNTGLAVQDTRAVSKLVQMRMLEWRLPWDSHEHSLVGLGWTALTALTGLTVKGRAGDTHRVAELARALPQLRRLEAWLPGADAQALAALEVECVLLAVLGAPTLVRGADPDL